MLRMHPRVSFSLPAASPMPLEGSRRTPASSRLCRRLLRRPASESGRLRHGEGTRGWGARRRRVLEVPRLSGPGLRLPGAQERTPMHRTLRTLALVTLGILLLSAPEASAQSSGQKWVTSWTGSVHGPYPLGFPSLPPEMKFAIPDPAKGAEDQTFRLIVKPDLWASRMRLRFSNVHGTRPLVLDGVYLGVQASAGNLVRGTNRPVTFAGGKKQLTAAPGGLARRHS